MHPYFAGPRPRAYAHRGWHTGDLDGCENTLAAFTRAAAEGFGYLELDVHASADAVAVVHHDVALDRTTDGTGPLTAHTAAELAKVRVRGREPIPRLAEVLEALPETRITIELKSAAVVEPTLAAVDAAQAWDRVCIGGFEQAWVNAARRGGGERLCTSMAKRDILALRARAWLARRPPVAAPRGRRARPGQRRADPGRGRGPAGHGARERPRGARLDDRRSRADAGAARPRRRRAPVGPTGPAARGAAGARPVADVSSRGRVFAWGLWDWGSSAYNAVILTFVFSVYLTDAVGRGLPGPIDAGAWLGYAIGAAGLLIALAAPVLGQRSDAAGRRKFATGVWTACTVATMAALFAVREDWHWLWLGLVLLALGSIFYELASVSYNAMLVQVSTPATIGRVSGFGWSMGYFGGIVQLLGVLRAASSRATAARSG